MRQVGPYEVVRELGRGAMGVVFEVRHPAVPDRLALKMILQPEQGGLERFRREAEVLGFLGRHPNVVGFREAGVEGGHPYIVMDFVEGETLDAALKRGLAQDEALRVLIEIARALHFGHEAEVVHRDVKPANILIDRAGRSYLSDFGVAKPLQADRLTLTGEMVGTPAYMAPEQLGGSELDRRADVYALGAVLYEILTGVRPFAGDKVSMAKKILLDPPPRPGALSQVPPPPDLERLCLTCLSKEPAARVPTAEDFARALEAHLQPEAGASSESPSPSRRGFSPALVAPLLLVAVLLGFGIGQQTAAAPAPSLVPTPSTDPAPPTLTSLELLALRGEASALTAIAGRSDATPAEALATARALCAAVRVDPAAKSALGPRLLTLAEALLAAVDPTRDRDALLVEQAWDCLVAARVVAPEVSAASAMKAIDRLFEAKATAVRRAASPWRAMWEDDSILLSSAVVERALASVAPIEPTARAGERDTLPMPWGAVVQQVASHTNWWHGRYVRSEVRYRVFAELALRRPQMGLLDYELGMALFQRGRLPEAMVLLVRGARNHPGAGAWYRVSRVAHLFRPAAEAEGYSREGMKHGGEGRPWHELQLIELLQEQGGQTRLREAKQLLEKNALRNKNNWRWVNLWRAVAKGLGEELPVYWPGRERGFRLQAIDKWLKRYEFPPAAASDVYPRPE